MKPEFIPAEELQHVQPYELLLIGANQPEYEPLPAVMFPGPEGRMVTRWRPSLDERRAIMDGACVELAVMTFNEPLQPVLLGVQGVRYDCGHAPAHAVFPDGAPA
ncbi:MAG: hypothetical protein AB7I38_11065 [Dehalococcoidia bacterium]